MGRLSGGIAQCLTWSPLADHAVRRALQNECIQYFPKLISSCAQCGDQCIVARDMARRTQPRLELYSTILSKIMSGEFQPGQRLVEEELARTYHVSRTPIREALLALAKDGVVNRTRNRGARVASFKLDDVEQLYDIRKLLEGLAVRTAVRNLQLDDLLRIQRRLRFLKTHKGPNWHQEQAEIDLELHRLILDHSGNRHLFSLAENISRLIHSLRLLAWQDKERAREATEEHLAIVDALIRRDAKLAEKVLTNHIEAAKQALVAVFSLGNEKR